MTRPATAPQESLIWWLKPQGLILGFLIPIFLVVMLLGEMQSPALTIRGLTFLDTGYSLIGIGYLLLMACAAHVGGHIDLQDHGPVNERPWLFPAVLLGCLALMAYAVWFKGFILNPSSLLQVFSVSEKVSRTELNTAVGLTSLTNLTPVFFCLVAHLYARQPQCLPGYVKAMGCLLLVLTVFRVYIWGERLALIEVVMAAGVPMAWARYQQTRSRVVRSVLTLLPLLGIPILLLYFGAAEYFRSWQSDFYQSSNLSFWEFASGRLASYYYTSLNNGAGILETQPWPTYRMENVLQFVYKAPFLVGPIARYYFQDDIDRIDVFLNSYGDPEFNNPSGVFMVLLDLGYGGGAVYFLLLGFLSGVSAKAFAKEQLRGLLTYPFMLVTMLEMFRYPYLGSSRAFTIMLGVGLVMISMSMSINMRLAKRAL